MKKVCIVCSAKLPQPPVLGGAVSQLIQHWINENEKEKHFDITCISVFNEKAKELSKNLKNTQISYVKIKRIHKFFDSLISCFLNIIKKTNKIYAWGFLFRTLAFRRGVKKVLLKNNFDVVVFENSIPVALCMKRRKLLKKYKNKYFYHTHSIPRSAFNSGKVLENAKAVICVSDYIKNETLMRFSKYHLNCCVLYNCVDTNIFKPQDQNNIKKWRGELGIKPADFVVGFIGRLSVDKGIFELLESIKRIIDSSVKLLIVGSTFYGSNTKDKLIKRLAKVAEPIKDRVIFTGYIDNSKTPLFYCSSNVICLPPVWEEPGSIANIEAAACGCPIIGTFSGGNKEYIGDNRSILLKKNDKNLLIDELANSILEIKNNDNLRNRISNNAYNWGKEQTAKEFFDRFIKTIER